MRGVLQRSLAKCATSAGLVHRLMGEVVLLDTQVSRLMERSGSVHNAAAAAAHTPACTSYFSTRFNDGGVRELSTTAAARIVLEDTKQQDTSKEDQAIDRDEYREKQSPHMAHFEKVTEAPQPQSTKQQWWKPDPETGIWGPEDQEGQLTTSTPASKSSSHRSRVRAKNPTSLEVRMWWTSMEELPDMDRRE